MRFIQNYLDLKIISLKKVLHKEVLHELTTIFWARFEEIKFKEPNLTSLENFTEIILLEDGDNLESILSLIFDRTRPNLYSLPIIFVDISKGVYEIRFSGTNLIILIHRELMDETLEKYLIKWLENS